jgi:hypothetical protein
MTRADHRHPAELLLAWKTDQFSLPFFIGEKECFELPGFSTSH